jgi:hypothetical protein
MSLVTRKGVVGDGDGLGEGKGVGVGVCAKAFSGILVTASPAAPAAGSSLTKLRRSIDLRFGFFMVSAWASCPLGTHASGVQWFQWHRLQSVIVWL